MQARHKAEHASSLYSQSGELQVALEKQLWEDLELILVQAPERGKEKEHEEMSKDMTLDQGTHRLPQSTHQQVFRHLDLSSRDAQHVEGISVLQNVESGGG